MLFGFFMPFSSHTCFTMPKSPYFLRQMALRVSPRIMVYDVGCVAVCVVPVVLVAVSFVPVAPAVVSVTPVVPAVGNASGGVTSDHGMPSAEFPVVVPDVPVELVPMELLLVVVPFAVAVLPSVRAEPFVAVPAVFPSSMPVV